MKRVDHPTAASGLYTEGNPTTSTPATVIEAEWLNNVQEEICNVIEDADGGNTALNGASNVQLKAAILAMIAAGGGGGGGGGGSIVAITQAILGSTASTTSTTNVTTGLTISPTLADAANDCLIEVNLDVEALDASGSGASGSYVLQYSNDNSSFSDLKTLTHSFSCTAGQVLAATGKQTLGSDFSTTSTTDQVGLTYDYTPVAGANRRLVQATAEIKALDTNGSACYGIVTLQYFNGSTWANLATLHEQTVAGGVPNVAGKGTHTVEYDHNVSDDSPQYRLVIKNNDSGNTANLIAGSFIQIKEYATLGISSYRTSIAATHKHSPAETSPHYRVVHRAANGDTSNVYSGSVIRCIETTL